MVWRAGLTAAELLQELDHAQRYEAVRMNAKTVTRPNFETTQVPDGARVLLVPMIVGSWYIHLYKIKMKMSHHTE